MLEVQLAGQQLGKDVDFVRTRALAARSLARVKFDNSSMPSYSGYLDTDADSGWRSQPREAGAAWVRPPRIPARVAYGRDRFPPFRITAADRPHIDEARWISSRGIVQPMGQGGVVYLKHTVKRQSSWPLKLLRRASYAVDVQERELAMIASRRISSRRG